MRYLYFLFGFLFFGIAAIQWNDPDPMYWIPVYSGTAMVAIAKGLGKSSLFWNALLIGGIAAGLLIAAPGVADYLTSGDLSLTGDMARASHIEPAREFGGLLLALALVASCLRSKNWLKR